MTGANPPDSQVNSAPNGVHDVSRHADNNRSPPAPIEQYFRSVV